MFLSYIICHLLHMPVYPYISSLLIYVICNLVFFSYKWLVWLCVFTVPAQSLPWRVECKANSDGAFEATETQGIHPSHFAFFPQLITWINILGFSSLKIAIQGVLRFQHLRQACWEWRIIEDYKLFCTLYVFRRITGIWESVVLLTFWETTDLRVWVSWSLAWKLLNTCTGGIRPRWSFWEYDVMFNVLTYSQDKSSMNSSHSNDRITPGYQLWLSSSSSPFLNFWVSHSF